ncbi:MAG: OBG GTPase family GTP-binding protein [Nitrososphaerales archaeon]
MGIPEKIRRIEEDIRKTKVNKATEHHVGILKAKLSKLKTEQDERRSHGGGSSTGYDTRRAGDATVALVGLPNVGKSTLLNHLTNAKSKVGSYAFTTLEVVPGMMEYNGARIQILDLPGIVGGAASGKGFGKRVLSVARSADLIILLLDVFHPDQSPLLRRELAEMGIRLDENPPDIVIDKRSSGGLEISITVPIDVPEDLIKGILRVYGVHHGRVLIREKVTTDQLIDIISGNRIYTKSITLVNKIDLVNQGFLNEVKERIGAEFVPISADANLNINGLKQIIYDKLDLIRIYMKPRGEETDYEEPMIVQHGSTVLDVCDKVHRNLRKGFRYGFVWGKSVKFNGQRVGMDHTLLDGDVLTIIGTRQTRSG